MVWCQPLGTPTAVRRGHDPSTPLALKNNQPEGEFRVSESADGPPPCSSSTALTPIAKPLQSLPAN